MRDPEGTLERFKDYFDEDYLASEYRESLLAVIRSIQQDAYAAGYARAREEAAKVCRGPLPEHCQRVAAEFCAVAIRQLPIPAAPSGDSTTAPTRETT